jgi:hypothetical protein
MSGNGERGRGLRRPEKHAIEEVTGHFEKPALDARAAPPKAPESIIGRETVAEVPLTGLSFAPEEPVRRQQGIGPMLKHARYGI